MQLFNLNSVILSLSHEVLRLYVELCVIIIIIIIIDLELCRSVAQDVAERNTDEEKYRGGELPGLEVVL